MPKRIIDGEGLWNSDKLAQVEPVWMRAEYANLLPLAQANGSFECNPRHVWSQVYAYNRSEVKVETVEEILNELERVKLLFRWESEGKIWGYWTGIERPGRLPPPSRKNHYPCGAIPPASLLESFMKTDGYPLANQRLSNGYIGIGIGIGTGIGSEELFNSHQYLHSRTLAKSRTRKRSAATQLPDDFAITEKHLEWARRHNLENLEPYLERFKLHYQANGKTMKNWDAAFYNWILSPYQTSAGKGNGQAVRRSLTDEEFTNAVAEADRELADRAGPRH